MLQPATSLEPIFEIEESELPILYVRYPPRGTVAMLEQAFREYRRIASQNPRVAYLLDMRDFDPTSAPAATRQRAAQLHDQYASELAVSAVCEARVVNSPLVKGILIAFDWLKGTGHWPCRTFTRMSDARQWVQEELDARPSKSPLHKRSARPL